MKLKLDSRSIKVYLWRNKPVLPLAVSLQSKSGRDISGQISVNHMGGRGKLNFRILDFKRNFFIGRSFHILRVEYDPSRSSSVFLGVYDNGILSYIPSFLGMSYSKPIYNYASLPVGGALNSGDCLPIGFLSTGTLVNNIEDKQNSGFKYSRAALTSSILIRKLQDSVIVKLPSGKFRRFSGLERCVVGYSGIGRLTFRNYSKAGQKRLLGFRPHVRGVAMNPVDHPHGGGEGKTSGGRHSVSPWGRLTKGYKTRKPKSYSRHLKFSY